MPNDAPPEQSACKWQILAIIVESFRVGTDGKNRPYLMMSDRDAFLQQSARLDARSLPTPRNLR
jgi:hypothetical protein